MIKIVVALVVLILLVSCNCECDIWIPKHYVAYHLNSNETITVDGKLDEPAWQNVAWTEDFQDIEGPRRPVPRFKTRAKMRWDDKNLYIGGFVDGNEIWANMTEHDSVVFNDNDFEVFIDPDATTHYYKEMELNAINTLWDLMLNKPYMNGGTANNSWESYMQSAVYIDGRVNDPTANNKYWTIELAIPFKYLIESDVYATDPPKRNDQWRINFSRVQWKVVVVNGKYMKVPNTPEDNWVWSPQTFFDWTGAVNMHIPERWGFVQFATGPINGTNFIRPADWNVRVALNEVYYALSKFFAVNGNYPLPITDLELPDWVFEQKCTKLPNYDGQRWGWNLNVTSLDSKIVGTIDQSRNIVIKQIAK